MGRMTEAPPTPTTPLDYSYQDQAQVTLSYHDSSRRGEA